MEKNLGNAIFAQGCFWGVEDIFRKVPGVVDVRVGYTGGHTQNPTYQEVCGHFTGHAEAVKISFDSALVSYEKLLEVFWSSHNPTTLNRQGPDVGDQYRSAIFYTDEIQKSLAEKSKKELAESGKWDSEIVTEIAPSDIFYDAEEYHQRYFEKNGGGTCHI